MEIYIAARYSRLEEANKYAEQLRALGHTVSARWLTGSHQIPDGAMLIDTKGLPSMPPEAVPFAQEDIADVWKADMLIALTEKPRSSNSRGGRHVEFGIMLALKALPHSVGRKRLVVVGPRENVFHTLPEVEHFVDWHEFMENAGHLRDYYADR